MLQVASHLPKRDMVVAALLRAGADPNPGSRRLNEANRGEFSSSGEERCDTLQLGRRTAARSGCATPNGV